MSHPTSLLDTLSTLTTSTELAHSNLPKSDTLLPPENSITLLDTKNEIFLSYLQTLALRNLHVLRSVREGGDVEDVRKLSDQVTKKLVELRVYLERGVRPLEGRIKYQVDRAVNAAEDEERASAVRKVDTRRKGSGGEGSDEEEEEEDDDEDSDSDSDAELGTDMSGFRPQISAMEMPGSRSAETTRRAKSSEGGVYKPPRVSATAMPSTEQRERKKERPGRSATIDEYVSTELSTAPLAQPSIGSNLIAGGRSTKSARQLKEDAARRDYEETHLTRLPVMSKKELARRGLGRAKDGGFGGEEWRGIGDSLDRIGDLTRRKGKDSALDKSRKRRAVEDGPRGDGIGASFDVKKRRLEKKGRR